INVEEWNHAIDHVHVLFKANPKTDLVKFLNSFKSASSRIVKKEYPHIREKLWKESSWAKSYCLITMGGASIETLRKYMETQVRELKWLSTEHTNLDCIQIRNKKS